MSLIFTSLEYHHRRHRFLPLSCVLHSLYQYSPYQYNTLNVSLNTVRRVYSSLLSFEGSSARLFLFISMGRGASSSSFVSFSMARRVSPFFLCFCFDEVGRVHPLVLLFCLSMGRGVFAFLATVPVSEIPIICIYFMDVVLLLRFGEPVPFVSSTPLSEFPGTHFPYVHLALFCF